MASAKVIKMTKISKHIQIVRTDRAGAGGMSKSTQDKVFAVLTKRYSKVGISIINTLKDLDTLADLSPDLVFLGAPKLKLDQDGGPEGRVVWLSEFLDQKGIRYTGSNMTAMDINNDKVLAKQAIADAGLPTSAHFTAIPGEYGPNDNLDILYPLFIKPISSGGSKGIDELSVAHNFDDFSSKVESIFNVFGTRALVESFLQGREYSVAILGFGAEASAMPIEILTDKNAKGDRILCHDVKKEDTERVVKVVDPILRARIAALSLTMFRVLGGRDYGRIDLRMDSAGKIYFLEANLAPGLGGGYFTRACSLNGGLEYADTILAIAELGLAHRCSTKIADSLAPIRVNQD